MKSKVTTVQGANFITFREATISKVEGLEQLISSYTKRISISYFSASTIQTYRRAVCDVSLFHRCLPGELELDQILDYLHHLKEKDLS